MDQRKLIGIGPEFKSLLLTVLLLQEDNVKARSLIIQKLAIDSIGGEIKISLKRPDYAQGNNAYAVNEFLGSAEDKRFWGAEGFMADFLDQLYSLDKIDNPPVRDEGYLNPGDNENDRYVMYRKVSSFKEQFNDQTGLDLFVAFDNLRTIGILENVSLEITLNSGQKANINQFSDGQFLCGQIEFQTNYSKINPKIAYLTDQLKMNYLKGLPTIINRPCPTETQPQSNSHLCFEQDFVLDRGCIPLY